MPSVETKRKKEENFSIANILIGAFLYTINIFYAVTTVLSMKMFMLMPGGMLTSNFQLVFRRFRA